MSEIVKFEHGLDIFQNIVVLFRSMDGKLYIGNTYYYNGRGDADDWMSVMYKDALNEENGILLGWNELDDNSPNITLVPEAAAETGVEDFLCAHESTEHWNSLDYVEIHSYPEIETYMNSHVLPNSFAIAFGIRR
ncbi:MAG: hypothetical protein IJ225_04635 [Solobacterium sp.]|nr:hypothetical protein [Solobacterium sp.]